MADDTDAAVTIPNESGWIVDALIREMDWLARAREAVSGGNALPTTPFQNPQTAQADAVDGKQSYIEHAREELDFLQHGIGNPDDSRKRLYDYLNAAGVDASVLDPEGKSSAAQMQAAIGEAYKQGNLVIARQDYDNIERYNRDTTQYQGEDAENRKLLHKLDLREMNAALAKAGVGVDALKSVVLTTASDDLVDLFKKHPEKVDMLVGAYNNAYPDLRMSNEDQGLLRDSPRLAEAVFGNRLKDLIAGGYTSVAELSGKPQELLNLVGYPRIAKAIAEGVITIRQLSELPPERLKEAATALQQGDSPAQSVGVAQLLGLDQSHTERFVAVVNALHAQAMPLLAGGTTPDATPGLLNRRGQAPGIY